MFKNSIDAVRPPHSGLTTSYPTAGTEAGCYHCPRVGFAIGQNFWHLLYAPEIAQAMLMRQQALALIEARKTIVDGAVAIVCDSLNKLQAAGIQMTDSQKEALISNLLVVLCSGERAQPVMQVQAHSSS